MLSKFKSISLKSLGIFVRNLPSAESLVLNSSKSGQLAQLATLQATKLAESTAKQDEYRRRNHRSNQSRVFNKTNYLLVGAFSIAYLDRQYDLFKNYFNQFKVHAKVIQTEEPVILPADESLKKSVQHKPNIRQTFNFIADAVEQAIPSVVQIEVYERDPYFHNLTKVNSGSGFIISKDGSTSLILTNSHVVLDHTTVNVQFHNGKQLVGEVECVDRQTDLASIKIEDTSLPPLQFESSKDIRVGEFVVAIGSPVGFSNSVTAGIVSSTTRVGKDIGLENDEMEYLQTDASINLGNSGGPLLSLDGKVVGINTFKILHGVNLAIPSDYAIEFLETAKKYTRNPPNEEKRRRFFGITMLSLTPDVLNQLRERKTGFSNLTHGVLLLKVEPGSIADKAGLRRGDVIIETNHKKSTDAAEIYKTIEENSQLTLLVVRDGEQKIRFNVTFE